MSQIAKSLFQIEMFLVHCKC